MSFGEVNKSTNDRLMRLAISGDQTVRDPRRLEMLCCGLCVLASHLFLPCLWKNHRFPNNDGLESLFLEKHKDLFTPYGAQIDQRKNFV